MIIRVATPEDFEQVYTLAMNFALASPYHEFVIPETVADFTKAMLAKPTNEAIVLIADGGLIAGVAQAFQFGQVKAAAEVGWWVDPDKRKDGLGQELIEALEYWAERLGCAFITMVSLDDQLGKYYEKRGYKLQERVYMKELN